MIWGYGSVFLIYAGLRVLAWVGAVELEDHDSTSYLSNAERVLRGGLLAMAETGPDHTPFYPAMTALFGLPGWSTVFAARLTSFAFSVLLLLVFVLLGRRILKPAETLVGALLLAFCPFLVPFSVSILSEPSFVAVVYLGIWLFWLQYRGPRWWTASALGVVFGLAFLDRFEGLVYLGVIPSVQAAHYVFGRMSGGERRYGLPALTRWVAVYVVAFVLVATPQVWRVSETMGSFALNGRQLWSVLQVQQEGRTTEESIFGLDYSPSETNLQYLQTHAEERRELAATAAAEGAGVRSYVRLAARNAERLYYGHFITLIGAAGLAFFAFGMVGLWRAEQRFEVFLVSAFLGAMLLAPIVHATVVLRHVTVVVPLVLLVAGRGLVDMARLLSPRRRTRILLAGGLASFTIAAWILPLRDYLLDRAVNREYDPAALEEPIRVLSEHQATFSDRPPTFAARKGYLGYFARASGVPLRTGVTIPHTDYDGLIEYLKLNEVDFVYIEYRNLSDRSFLHRFEAASPPAGFRRLYRGTDEHGNVTELYRFHHGRAQRSEAENEPAG